MQHHTEETTRTELDRIAQHPEIAPLVRAMAGRAPALVEPGTHRVGPRWRCS